MVIDEKTFVGVTLNDPHFLYESIRAMFSKGYVDICHIHRLPGYHYNTFAKWVQDLHCKHDIDPRLLERAKAYTVNYFLCPEADTDLEVFAIMGEIWPKPEKKSIQRGFSIGNFWIEWGYNPKN